MLEQAEELGAAEAVRACVERAFRSEIVPRLEQYIRIPNKSPLYDPQWQQHGHMERAVQLVAEFCRTRSIRGLSVEIVRLEGRTPLIFMEIPSSAAASDTVLLYGHLDKQPEFQGWAEGLGPWEPVLREDRLYGRGGADDGYAAFAALTAIEALEHTGQPHARCVVIIEACEESGSYDLPAYVDYLRPRLGEVSFVVCLDSGCGDYERLWTTTSLRGLLTGNLVVEVLREGVHSGDAGGIVASSFRIARALLSRIEDEQSGAIKPRALHVRIPRERTAQIRDTAKVLKGTLLASYPWVQGMRPLQRDPARLLESRTWEPSLAVIGAAGLPDLGSAGNVLRPQTTLKLSLRLPPTCDAERATLHVKRLLERDPPYGARVCFEAEKAAQGWNAAALEPWLADALEAASLEAFGKSARFLGEGGSIPFMAMLGERFPRAQFFITGVLGPASNAHGPNEFLHLPTAMRVTQCVAHVLCAHALRSTFATKERARPTARTSAAARRTRSKRKAARGRRKAARAR